MALWITLEQSESQATSQLEFHQQQKELENICLPVQCLREVLINRQRVKWG